MWAFIPAITNWAGATPLRARAPNSGAQGWEISRAGSVRVNRLEEQAREPDVELLHERGVVEEGGRQAVEDGYRHLEVDPVEGCDPVVGRELPGDGLQPGDDILDGRHVAHPRSPRGAQAPHMCDRHRIPSSVPAALVARLAAHADSRTHALP